jgi:pyruvate dehydrogenase kinase 2/3/4
LTTYKTRSRRLLKTVRLAHRLRDIQTLPYVVVANPHLAHVYESYLRAFERFRRVPEIRSLEDNDKYCKVLEETLTEHATVIPRLAIGVLEVRGLMKAEETDKFMTTMLRSVWSHASSDGWQIANIRSASRDGSSRNNT